MTGSFLISAAVIVAIGLLVKISKWRSYYMIAERTGFRTFYSPVHITDMWWLILYPVLGPLLSIAPELWKKHWLPLSMPWSIWKAGYEPFRTAGDDSIILACSKGNILWTCDPAIAKQLFTLHTIQVPVDLIKFHDIWGPTVGSVEGQEWKTHRKIITYGFNPTTLPVVWKNSIHQTETLIERWGHDDYIVKSPRIWMSRIALHVIAGVFFDTKMDWEDTESPDTKEDNYISSLPNAILTIMLRLGVLFMTPKWLLGRLPFQMFKETNQTFHDFTNYMLDLRVNVLERVEEVSAKRTKTMLESIVVAGNIDSSDPSDKPLSKESVLGNIFFMMMAGHETAGNTLGFAILLLAIHPGYQRQVQRELDDVLGNRPKSSWSVDSDYQTLQRGYLGAVLLETMRLYHPVQFIWRTNVAETTFYDSAGKSHVVPANTIFCLNFAAAFSNPSTWPQQEITPQRREELHYSRAVDFDPARWLRTMGPVDIPIHWPFGQGSRPCPGKPMAQIEMVAVIATLLKEYSIDLVVAENVLKECRGNYQLAWERTRDDAIRKLEDDIEANLTIAMLKNPPVRLQRRSERYNSS